MFFAPISGVGFSAAFAPRVEVYASLACRAHKPHYFPDGPSGSISQSLDYIFPPGPHNEIANSPTSFDVDESPLLFFPNSIDYASGFHFEVDPDVRKKCATDPDVQAAVARLLASLSWYLFRMVFVLIS